MFFCPDSGKLTEKIQTTFGAYLAEQTIGNAAVSVWQNGYVVCKAFFGSRTLNGNERVDENTLFRLASMTKPVTAVAVMMQYESGLLDLDAPVSQYLPEFESLFVGKEENAAIVPFQKVQHAVTPRHLLTHTSGIGSGAFGDVQIRQMPDAQKHSLQDAVAYYATLPLLFDPGTRTEYSAVFGFDILARLVEVTSKKSFDAYLNEKLFLPLGMRDTVFAPSEEQQNRLVYLHDKRDGHSVDASPELCELFGGIPNSRCGGGTSLASTLADYEKFAQMLLNEGTYNGECLLQRESVRQMKIAQVSEQIMPGAQRWGLGMRVIASDGYDFLPVGSFGWSGAYGTHFWVDPQNGITAVLMRNSLVDGGAGAKAAVQLERIVYGE